jgi:hypothetical protein
MSALHPLCIILIDHLLTLIHFGLNVKCRSYNTVTTALALLLSFYPNYLTLFCRCLDLLIAEQPLPYPDKHSTP